MCLIYFLIVYCLLRILIVFRLQIVLGEITNNMVRYKLKKFTAVENKRADR